MSMTNKQLTLVAISILTLLISCRKYPDAGGESCTYYFNDFEPNLIVTKSDSLQMDINHDGIIDMVFYTSQSQGITNAINHKIFVHPRNENTFIAPTFLFEPCDSPLTLNTPLDTNSHTFNEWVFRFSLDLIPYDRNYYNNGGYLGIRLKKDGNYYLGWMYLKVRNDSLIIDNYTLSTCANKPILIGKK